MYNHNMNYNIAICDDENTVCMQLNNMLKTFQDEKHVVFDISFYHSAEEYLKKGSVSDILFLDIQMGNMDGLSLARKLRSDNNPCIIIFITNMVQFAVEGYEVHAFGFLPKPLSFAMLEMYLNDAIMQLNSKKGLKLDLYYNTEHRIVESNNVLFFESYGHRINVHTKDEVFPCITTMSKLEELLKNADFFRCHNSYLINLKEITKISADIVELGENKVLVSRHRRKALLEKYLKLTV